MREYTFCLVAHSELIRTVVVEAECLEDAEEIARDAGEESINEGDLNDWDMSPNTELVSCELEEDHADVL